MTLMLDVEQRYSRVDALRAARELEAMGFRWFEAPLPDTDLEGYRELRRQVGIPILPAGNWVLDPHLIEVGIGMGCWSAVRVDATVAGGITPGRKIMALAEAHGLDTELQCWGYTLTQAANLHLMLAHRNCTYFEQPVPYPARARRAGRHPDRRGGSRAGAVGAGARDWHRLGDRRGGHDSALRGHGLTGRGQARAAPERPRSAR